MQTLLVADYHALEVVILADLCKRLFNDDQLERMTAPDAPDIHTYNAKVVFGDYLGWKGPDGVRVQDIPDVSFKTDGTWASTLRNMIKTVWYGLSYGKGAYGFSTLPGPDGKAIGEEVAAKMLAGIEVAVAGPFKWQRWCREFVDEHRGIYSLGGRWCPLYKETEDGAPDWLRARAYRRAYNFPMQATGAEIIGNAMVTLAADREFAALGFVVCLQVHDELVCRGPLENVIPAARILKRHMTGATANGTPLLVPLRVSTEFGLNYYDLKKLEV